MTAEQICRAYNVPIFDYEGDRRGVLIAGGSGLMLGTMDVLSIRYCIDGDSLNPASDAISSVILLLARYVAPVFIAGWYTSKSPEKMRAGVALAEQYGLESKILCYIGGNTGFLSDRQQTCLSAFYAAAQRMLSSDIDAQAR